METTLLCMLRENAPALLYFFLVVVVVILSSVKKHPPTLLQMEPKRLSQFPLHGGEEF